MIVQFFTGCKMYIYLILEDEEVVMAAMTKQLAERWLKQHIEVNNKLADAIDKAWSVLSNWQRINFPVLTLPNGISRIENLGELGHQVFLESLASQGYTEADWESFEYKLKLKNFTIKKQEVLTALTE